MDVHEYKMQFAVLLQRVPKRDRMQCAGTVAKQVVGKDQAAKYPLYVLQIAEEWPFDSEVIAEVDRLDAIPLSKEAVLQHILNLCISRDVEDKTKVAALRLYCDACGWTRSNKEDGTVNPDLSKIQQLLEASTASE